MLSITVLMEILSTWVQYSNRYNGMQERGEPEAMQLHLLVLEEGDVLHLPALSSGDAPASGLLLP
jgi:hypothetical protein